MRVKSNSSYPGLSRAGIRRKQHTQKPKSLWPIWLRATFDALHEVPWIALTTLSILAGSAVQLVYFKSIGHIPSDLAALTSLAISTSAAALVMLAAIATGFFLPSIMAIAYSADQATSGETPFSPSELISAPMAIMGALVTYWVYEKSVECSTSLNLAFYVSAAISVLGWAHTAVIYARGDLRGSRFKRLLFTAIIGFMSIGPVLALIPLEKLLGSGRIDVSLLLLSTWVLFLAINAKARDQDFNFLQLCFFAVLTAILTYVPIAMTFDRFSTMSANIAELIGIRSAGPVTVMLSQKACLLVRAASIQGGSPQVNDCEKQEGNVQRVTILSNVGSRFVLALETPPPLAAIHITVPSEGVQMLNELSRKSVQKTACGKR